MNDSPDLRKILKAWPYDPEHDARIVRGDDGRELLQVRTPLGLEQYEMDGRPDGLRLHGMESLLEHHLQRLNQAKFAGREADFGLSPQECGELFHEGTLYYFRYVRLFQLKDWARTIRDTARNLRAFDFLHRYARREEDQQFLEKWRPYILRVNASALVMQAMEKGAHDEALKLAREAIVKVESLEELEDDTFKFERERSLMALRELESQIQKNRPLSELEQLRASTPPRHRQAGVRARRPPPRPHPRPPATAHLLSASVRRPRQTAHPRQRVFLRIRLPWRQPLAEFRSRASGRLLSWVPHPHLPGDLAPDSFCAGPGGAQPPPSEILPPRASVLSGVAAAVVTG